MQLYIFLYNVIHIKSDFTRMSVSEHHKMVLIASPYCLKQLSFRNRCCFEDIHQIPRDFHQVDEMEIENILLHYLKSYEAQNVRLFTNEDSTQLVCANLRQKYQIPGNSYEQVLPFVNKVISKEKLENAVRKPKYLKFNKHEYTENKTGYLNFLYEKLNFPMFAKPIDLVSSVETHYIPDLNVLTQVAERISGHNYEFEIDEFIDGELFHCDAMYIDKKIQFFMVGKCSFALSRFFEGKPVGSIPIVDEIMFNTLQNFCQTVLEKLNGFDSAYHMEVFLDKKSKEFIFLEIGARTGGALITNVYQKLFDINIEETHYLIQMQRLKELKFTQKDIYAGFLNFPKIKGQLAAIEQPSLNIEYEFIEFVKSGEQMNQAENLLDIACSIIFWDKSYEKVKETFEFLKNYNPTRIIESQTTESKILASSELISV